MPINADAEDSRAGNQELEAIEEVVVSGMRRAMRNALSIKRESDGVVDALSSADIGDIPSLSVAEALEGIPGATTHRLKGSGSQVSVRGLGPFLGFSTFNGREVTTGSADRSVNFQQFPAELINSIKIYKTQQANMVEGGTSGIVELESLKPLDYGKQATQVDVRGKYNSHAARVEGNDGLGGRGSITHVNQFKTSAGDFGLAVGAARFDSGNPEESFLTSSNWQLCNAADPASGTSRCNSYDQGDQADDMAAGDTSAQPYLIPNSLTYRTLDEYERRNALISTLQWQLDDVWEIVADVEWSKKYYEEDRHDFQIDDARREHTNVNARPDYTLLSYDGVSRTRNDGELYRRDEAYLGGGLQVTWTPNEDWESSVDISYARTERDRVRRLARFRSDYIAYNFSANGLIPEVIFDTSAAESAGGRSIDQDYDVTDMATFDQQSQFRLRTRLTNREDQINAIRWDNTYHFDDNDFFTSIESGIRYSEHQRITNNEDTRDMNLGQINETYWNGENTEDALFAMALGCAHDEFPNSDFFGSGEGGNNIGGEFATFDTGCAISSLTQGQSRSLDPEDRRGTNDIDVTESITAAYVMAKFERELGDKNVTGNFGLRVVKTDVDSRGLRVDYSVEHDPLTDTYRVEEGDDYTSVRFTSSNTQFLPSVNATFELSDELQLRTAVYRALSRYNIEFMGAGRDFGDIDSDAEYESASLALEAQLENASGGNPHIEPFMSWNGDLSLEWYASEDTAVSAAIYYKSFEAEIFPAVVDETIDVDGIEVPVQTTKQVLVDDTSSLVGLEISAQHAFTSLPSPYDGLGVKFSYNYADTNFETQDPILGDSLNESEGTVTLGMTQLSPASIFGLSKHVGALTLYWDLGDFDFSATTKYRDDYFQPNAGSPKVNRWIEAFTLLDLSASYKFNDALKAKLTVQNLLDEPQTGHRGARRNSTTLWSSTGPKWELGLTASF